MGVDASQQATNIFQQASTLHQQGRLQEARTAYEHVVRLQPQNAPALNMLGVIALQLNDARSAIVRFEESTASDPSNPTAHVYQGMAYSMLGSHESAVRAYDRAIALDPESSALPHYNRANALMQLNRYESAVAGYDSAISFESDLDADAYFERGIALQRLKRPEAAIASFDQTIQLGSPRLGEVHFSRGASLQELGQHAAAVESFDRSLAIRPAADTHGARVVSLQELGHFELALAGLDALIAISPKHAEAHCARGILQIRIELFSAAIESFSRALALKPNYAPAINGRGLALAGLKQFEAALSEYSDAVLCDPIFAEAHFNRGNALISLGRLGAARSSFEAAIGCRQNYADALYNLGRVQQQLGDFDASLDAYEAAIVAKGSFVDAHINLGMLLKDCGDTDAAVESFRRALDLDANSVAAHSNLAFSLMFISEDPRSMLSECRRFNDRFAAGLKDSAGESNRRATRSGERRLRIGYVSPDFNDHCQSFFTLPLLEHHDRSAFEITCYSSVKQPDNVTARIKARVDTFREVRGLTDAALASLVRKDEIDILVDLTMHMAHGRPLLFARRPAPVQVAWLAYPGTTGIVAIDYRFSDSRLDPPGFDSHYSERTIRLPDTFWCYDPLSLGPSINSPPGKARGQLTLGCLNNTCKLTDRTFRLWAPVLAALPNSRLLLMAPAGRSRSMLLKRARAAGIQKNEVQFVPRQPREEYLRSYHDIDLCLDTLPYNGHTTNLDSLWMGVPFVTRVGSTSVGRAGLSLLYQMGLTELAADSDDGFVSAAISLANDPQRLASLRQGLRQRLQSSPLMDGRRFAANVEHTYRAIHA